MGGAAATMHWQPLRIPAEVMSTKARPGFRNTEQGLWQRDLTATLQTDEELVWLRGENWSPEALGARGQLSSRLRETSITLVGAGTLGSAIAELLVRGGVWNLHVIDPERLVAGNLVRHSLGLEDVSRPKAQALAARLNRISPFARITFDVRHCTDERASKTQGTRIVLDTTGSDDVLHQLCSGPLEPETMLASFSMGLGATRLYSLCVPHLSMRFDDFQDAMQRWLLKDIKDFGSKSLPYGGHGCWHPLFPARCHEVVLHAAAAVDQLELFVAKPPSTWTLNVLEKRTDAAGSLSYGTGSISSE